MPQLRSTLDEASALVHIIVRVGPVALFSERFEPGLLRHEQWFIGRRSRLGRRLKARAARRIWGGG